MTTSVIEFPATEAFTPETFRSRIMDACQPVLLRGACKNWPAQKAAENSIENLFDYLRGFDSGCKAQAFLGDPEIEGRYFYGEGRDGFNFSRETLSLSEGLSRIIACTQDASRGSIYLGSLPVENHLPGFERDNRLPFIDPAIMPRIWVGNASHVSCHYDMFDNLACIVAGHRRFTLFPPDAIADLYVGPIDHTMAGPPVALAAGSAKNDPRFPRFERVRHRAITAELAPGDMLYLPKLWWHQVEATDPANVLINYWWDGFNAGPDAPLTTMMLAMIAIAERPPAERQAWRSVFDHYVFRSEGHPLAHLPEDKHGILGPLKAGNYRRIRAMVMQLLRGG